MVAAVVVSTGPRVVTRGADIEEAGTPNVVGRLGGDPEVEALVVEEDPDRGVQLGGVETLDLDPHLLLLAE